MSKSRKRKGRQRGRIAAQPSGRSKHALFFPDDTPPRGSYVRFVPQGFKVHYRDFAVAPREDFYKAFSRQAIDYNLDLLDQFTRNPQVDVHELVWAADLFLHYRRALLADKSAEPTPAEESLLHSLARYEVANQARARALGEIGEDLALIRLGLRFTRRTLCTALGRLLLESQLARLAHEEDPYVRSEARALTLIMSLERLVKRRGPGDRAIAFMLRLQYPEFWLQETLDDDTPCYILSRAQILEAVEVIWNPAAALSRLSPARASDPSGGKGDRYTSEMQSEGKIRQRITIGPPAAPSTASMSNSAARARFRDFQRRVDSGSLAPDEITQELDRLLGLPLSETLQGELRDVMTRIEWPSRLSADSAHLLCEYFLAHEFTHGGDLSSVEWAHYFAHMAWQSPHTQDDISNVPSVRWQLWCHSFAAYLLGTRRDIIDTATTLLDDIDIVLQQTPAGTQERFHLLLGASGLCQALWNGRTLVAFDQDDLASEERNVLYWEQLLDVCQTHTDGDWMSWATEQTAMANLRVARHYDGSRLYQRSLQAARRSVDLAVASSKTQGGELRTRSAVIAIMAAFLADKYEHEYPLHVITGWHPPTLPATPAEILQLQLARRHRTARQPATSVPQDSGRDKEDVAVILENSEAFNTEPALWLDFIVSLAGHETIPDRSFWPWLVAVARASRSDLDGDQQAIVAGLARRALRELRDRFDRLDADSGSWTVQGLAAASAAGYLNHGDTRRAIEALELGAALRASLMLRDQRLAPTVDPTARPDPATPVVVPAVLPGRATPRDITQLTARLGAPLVYLAATGTTGIAVILSPTRGTSHIMLPDLTTTALDNWLDSLHQRDDTGATTTAPARGVRGGRGDQPPTLQSVTTIITEARHAITPLLDHPTIATSPHIYLVAIGATAGLPWPAIFDRPTSLAPSATLLAAAHAHPTHTSPNPDHPLHGTAITNPTPTTHDDITYPPLPNATEEGRWLHDECAFTHLDGTNATYEALTSALTQPLTHLHLAMHGDVDTHAWSHQAHLLTATPPPPQAGPTSLSIDDITTTHPNHIFLAACWGGTPNRTLPDEAISFPTALLTTGARSVIAPLYPIDDEAAQYLVIRYYLHTLDDHEPPHQALHHAAQDTRNHPVHGNTSTWTAFTHTGTT